MDSALSFTLMLSLLLLIAAWLDGTRYLIPNWLNGLILLLYPAMLLMVPEGHAVSWLHGLYGFGAVFLLGYLLFATGVMGGGDIKLLSVLALWAGFDRPLVEFLLYSALLGGVLTIILIVGRYVIAFVAARLDWDASRIPRVFTYGQPLPYGIAIGAGFAIVLWSGHLPGLAGVGEMLKPHF